MAERFVLLGLAPPRAGWFTEVARWSTSAALPAEFVKCVSAEEVRARLGSGRRHSALLIDASGGIDRDLVAAADAVYTPVLAVGAPAEGARAGIEAGVATVLPPAFSRSELVAALDAHATPVDGAAQPPPILDDEPAATWRGQLVAVCGTGGTGASTVAMALAQAAADDVRQAGRVVLADLALRADQAMLHDAGDLGPGIQELAEACRTGRPDPDEVARLTFEVPRRAYRVLLGLRRPGAWAALRPRSSDAALDALRRTFRVVVADCTGDLEGEADGGSIDVEERNHLARTALRQADAAFVVGGPGLKGLHSLARLVADVAELGVPAPRLLPVVNRAPRSPRARADTGKALVRLSGVPTGGPVWVPERPIEDRLRDGTPLPRPIVEPLASGLAALLGPPGGRRSRRPVDALVEVRRPQRVEPGSIGFWGEA